MAAYMSEFDEYFKDDPDFSPPPPLPRRGRRVGKLTLLTDEDALKAEPRDYYLKGIFSPGEMSTIYGEPGCGKSFLALYLARAINQGREVLGRRVHQTNVLFLALEGVAGFEKRLKAQIINHQEAPGFSYIAQPIDLFADTAAKNDVTQAAGLIGAGIIVIDTLNRAIGAGSENDPADMGQFIQNIDAIRAATGAHILIIHHSGKDSTRGMRGHSSLLGAADVVIEVVREAPSRIRTIHIHKAKDDADGAQFRFQLNILELGTDADGDPITTCLVEELDAPDERNTVASLTTDEKLWLGELHELFSRDGTTKFIKPEDAFTVAIPVATRGVVREWCKTRGLVGVAHSVARDGVLSATDRSKFSRVLNALKSKGKIGIHGEYIWLV